VKVKKNRIVTRSYVIGLLLVVVFGLDSKRTYAQELILNHWDVVNEASKTDVDRTSIVFLSAVSYEQDRSKQYMRWLPIYSYSSYNTEYAYGYNDGALWQGNGFNQSMLFGAQGRFGSFEWTLAPQILYTQNTDFDLREDYGSRPPYQDRFTSGIDYVKRFGDEAITRVRLAQSELAYKVAGWRISLNNQNSIWGPALYNPTMMSTHAAAFPNLRIGSEVPWTTRAGRVEMQWIFGMTEESEYFNEDPSDDRQVYNAIVLGYEPHFFPGFSLSLKRMMRMLDKDRENNWDYIPLVTDFFRFSQVDDEGVVFERADQMIAVGFDWRIPEVDGRVYLDWVRGDFASDVPDFITQPEHNAGWVWGMVKNFPLRNQASIRFNFEQANYAGWETARLRASGSIYAHGQVRQGYTNQGQLLAGYIGPGSTNHSLTVTYLGLDAMMGFEYYRTRFNDDVYYLSLYNIIGNYQDIEHYLALSFGKQIGRLDFRGTAGVAIRDNYLFVPDDVRINWHPELVLRYHLD